MKGFLLSATRRSSGKTLIAMGLSRVLKNRGVTLAPFKKGPDYIDPMWLGIAAGKSCVNLDFNSMTEQEIVEKFTHHCRDHDMALIEGTMGLFDGVSALGLDSNAALAKQLKLPVVLVVDCKGMTRGIAPLLIGYQAFDAQLNLVGVILNNVSERRHESKLRSAIRDYTELPVVGAVPHQPEMSIDERHIGLLTSVEDQGAEQSVEKIASVVEATLDIDLLVDLLDQHCFDLMPHEYKEQLSCVQELRLGIARDRAFSFYYCDDIEMMKNSGIDIHYFSPLEDGGLPEVDALFIGGGFPEFHARRLACNQSMLDSVAGFCRSGRPVYAECGGLMYLARSLDWQGNRHRMAGYIPAEVRMNERPIGRGYVELTPTEKHLWHQSWEFAERQSNPVVRAHEFHHSSIGNIEEDVDYAWEIVRGHGLNGEYDGFVRQGVLAGFSHLRNTQGYPWIEYFTHYIARSHPG
ncbi:MAG: cobyrinate a,c-diamide synthase [Gammaproteobacteria bacterium]|nr:cobyrinate a,c-diamide synthase [Gammaproteobacteria bacterium]